MRRITQKEALDMMTTLNRAVAVYGLLHAHARGETDLTEDQLSGVVTGVALEATTVLRRVRGGEAPRLPDDGGRWIRAAHHRATRRRCRRRVH